uniref:Uncharacterized protein n=1 Tax=Timema cristinae TaxID=61476 RepID=A0A7R9D7R4_TIMCR|nr:unnamed protein product [Timema cristinae]
MTMAACCSAGGHGGGHKKVIIHVPYYVKKIHHTHTVYKIVDHGDEGGHGSLIGFSGTHDIGHGYGGAAEHQHIYH